MRVISSGIDLTNTHMAGSLRGAALVGLLLLGACSEAKMELTEDARFVHKPLEVGDAADPVPGPRSNYPGTFASMASNNKTNCQNLKEDLFAHDFQLEYIKDEGPLADDLPDDDERFVQYVNRKENSKSCEGVDLENIEIEIFQEFNPKRNYETFAHFDCNKRIFTAEVTADVGLIDIDDFDDDFPGFKRLLRTSYGANENAANIYERHRTGPGAPWDVKVNIGNMTEMTFLNVRARANRLDNDNLMSYVLNYTYDGCTLEKDLTQCGGKRHCWQLTTEDPINKKRTYNRSR